MSNRIPVGVQLFSVREQAAKDLPGVLRSIKEMGYDAVEFAGYYGHSAYDVRKMLDESGLKCCGTHTGLDQLLGDNFQKTVDFHKVIGCTMPIVPWMGDDRCGSVPALAVTSKLLNELAEKLKVHGMQTGYHAHNGDFKKLNGGRTRWDILFGSTCPDFVMQMDTGNCLDGGGDPVETIKRFPGRSVSVHLKEFGGPHGAVIGQGNVDWKGVFEASSSVGGAKWYVVEYEVKDVDTMQGVAKCREALRKFGI